jgi:hypothetical protein
MEVLMPPTKAKRKAPKRKLSPRQRALKETRAIFKRVTLTPDGRERMLEIFALTIGKYLSKWTRKGKDRWGGERKAFVLRCITAIATELAASAGANGASRAEVQRVSVKIMRKFGRVSTACRAQITASAPSANPQAQGDICAVFLA